MKISIGHGRTIPLADNHRCDITVHEGRIFNEVHYDIWHNDNALARYHNIIRVFRWELLLGRGKRLSHYLTEKKVMRVMKDLNDNIKALGIDDEIYLGGQKHKH